MTERFLIEGPGDADTTVILAHGTGAPMDSSPMSLASEALAKQGFMAARFEFSYTAARRTSGRRKPPPRAEDLGPEYVAAVADLGARSRLIIGGKSMGGRVASMIAEELYDQGLIAGLLCLGYPFHPPAKPEKLRTEHLQDLRVPTLICQGTRDVFGTREEVSGYVLSDRIGIHWIEDGDHDLRPRKKVAGFAAADHLLAMATAVKEWTDQL
jgi:predicted alpha/beta-hydrolase family hydrolase